MPRHAGNPARRPDQKPRQKPRPKRRAGAAPLSLGLAASLAISACGSGQPSNRTQSPTSSTAAAMDPGPSCIKPQDGNGCLPLAPASRRVDLARPSFSDPTAITNPTHPSSKLDQVIYGGQVEGSPFRTEFTRVPADKTITWDGQQVKVVTWQYLAFSDGRIQEVALDWFAQADNGAVWYFGEDVSDYEDGVVSTHEGTWLAGKDGPPGMIMPANPKVGDVYRSENVPELVFEEVTVKAVGQTVAGPSGPVSGAITVAELHFDGTREDKVFAPGFGEYSTGTPKGDLEQASLAVPTDALPGPMPAQLTPLSAAVREAFDRVGKRDWGGAATAGAGLKQAWGAYHSTGVPDLLDKQMTRDIAALTEAVAARESDAARAAALRVAQNDLDLRLRHQPVAKVDLARLDLWARQVMVDAAAKDPGSVAGDVAALELTRDRVRHTLDPASADRLDAQIRDLRRAADSQDVAAAAKAVPALLAALGAV
jgi:hypothetical protein